MPPELGITLPSQLDLSVRKVGDHSMGWCFCMANVSRGAQQEQRSQRVDQLDHDAHPRRRFERLNRDALATMETQPLRDVLRHIDTQISTGVPPRGATMHDLEVEWCYIRRELEFRGGRRDQ